MYDVRPYCWNFLKGHLDCWNIDFSCIIKSEEIFFLELLSHSYFAHQVLGLNHLLLFVRLWTTHALGQDPIYDLGPQPYNFGPKAKGPKLTLTRQFIYVNLK